MKRFFMSGPRLKDRGDSRLVITGPIGFNGYNAAKQFIPMWTTAKTYCASFILVVFGLLAVRVFALTEPPILAGGSAGDAQSNEGHSVSADGRYVVFSSFATNLVADDTNGVQDVFLWDTTANTVALVSRSATGAPGNGDSSLAVISADGVWVAFLSGADNLTSDTNGSTADVFLYNRLEASIELVSVSSTGQQSQTAADNPDINANGRYVTFDTAGALASGADSTVLNVFRRDNWRDTTSLVSRTPAGVAGNDMSFNAQMSAVCPRVASYRNESLPTGEFINSGQRLVSVRCDPWANHVVVS